MSSTRANSKPTASESKDPGAVIWPERHGDQQRDVLLCDADRPAGPAQLHKAGLDVVFRPHQKKFATTERGPSKNPASNSFFSSGAYETEEVLRRDAHKWEPCMKASARVRAATLSDR